ncbi:hypothetical protein [Mucilaginibacter sp.]|uniref:hypothetical protein n=1 Tax=Mucilaginibacter sp. TaxID=1882438 RepID=UPI002633C4A1|nr:hypothetical protein [Mucilaginibacter sp.]MDB5127660.1 hypothetical protein [Mucilaginibacter sp.]
MNVFTVKSDVRGLSVGFIIKALGTDRFIAETITGTASPIIISKKDNKWQLERPGSPCLEPDDVDALGLAIEKEISQ